MSARSRVPTDQRFDEKWVEEDRGYVTPCHVWRGATASNGYGVFAIGHHTEVSAHRYGYMRKHGGVPVGLQLDHLCRVKTCVNPDHLEPVTASVNTLRAPSPKRNQTYCIHGHLLNEANTYVKSNGTRMCRTCHRERQRRYRHDIT